MVCAGFAVAGIGVSLGGTRESLWGSAVWLGVLLVAGAGVHVGIKRWAPNSNESVFGIVALLTGIGWLMVVRIQPELAVGHTVAVVAGFSALVACLIATRCIEWCMRRPGVTGVIAIALAVLGSFGRGADISGGAYEPARQWLHLGALSVQPYALAKLAVMLAACGLTVTAPRWLGERLVFHRHVTGAMAAAVGSWALLVVWGDLASAVVIFAAAWLPLWLDNDDHSASPRPAAPPSVRTRALVGIITTYGIGVVVLASVNDGLSAQVRHWLNPWKAGGSAAVESIFAISAGGLSGVGPGLGAPDRIVAAHSDYVLAVIVEELGMLGGAAILAGFMLLIGVGAGIAQRAQGTHRLLGVTATVIIGLQAFASIAGVLRLTPHTVGALPFAAHGPAAMIGNCIAVGMLLAVSQVSGSARSQQHQPNPRQPNSSQLSPTRLSPTRLSPTRLRTGGS